MCWPVRGGEGLTRREKLGKLHSCPLSLSGLIPNASFGSENCVGIIEEALAPPILPLTSGAFTCQHGIKQRRASSLQYGVMQPFPGLEKPHEGVKYSRVAGEQCIWSVLWKQERPFHVNYDFFPQENSQRRVLLAL